jgi:hypothetical protein
MYSFNTENVYQMSYYKPMTVVGAGDIAVNEIDKFCPFIKITV